MANDRDITFPNPHDNQPQPSVDMKQETNVRPQSPGGPNSPKFVDPELPYEDEEGGCTCSGTEIQDGGGLLAM